MSLTPPFLDFTNTNLLWCSLLVETLHRLGLTQVVICPGSRSTPLTLAFVRHPHIEAIPVLDERSASFFALGLAQQSNRAVALVCTSGTAGANFYPAVIEAFESRVPLLVLTADRPPELRHCNAGQTINQQNLYGSFTHWAVELAVPGLEADLLAYLRQTLGHAWARSHDPVPGPVHLNVPFREPLTPQPEPAVTALADHFDPDRFFTHLSPAPPTTDFRAAPLLPPHLLKPWMNCDRGLIVAGVARPVDVEAYCGAIARLSQLLGWPVLAEGLSPVRNYAQQFPFLVSTYDTVLRYPDWATALTPECVLRIGDMPTSKLLRQWLSQHQPHQWVIDPGDRNLDPTHGRTIHLPLSITALAAQLPDQTAPTTAYLKSWLEADHQIRHALDEKFAATDDLFEAKVAWLLSQTLPEGTPLFIANSTPVRDVEWFWKPGDRHIRPYFNRGANGIDGTLSTALGIAHRNQSTVLLTGDLAFLHDTNGLLLTPKLQGHLTIVLINNNGGGIFELLPIAQYDPPFEDFFATPQQVDLTTLCAAYGIEHERLPSWDTLQQRLNPLPDTGIRLLELCCDRKRDARRRQEFWRPL